MKTQLSVMKQNLPVCRTRNSAFTKTQTDRVINNTKSLFNCGKMAIALVAVAFLVMMSAEKSAGQLLTENFSYTAGTTLVSNGWTASSGTGTNNLTVSSSGSGLTYSGSTASGIGFSAPFLNTGEDAGRTFTTVSTGNLYISFLVKITASQTTGDYFFSPITGSIASPAYAARVYVKTSGGGFVFGCAKGTQTVTYGAITRNLNEVYQVVIKYAWNTGNTTDDIVSMYVNPTLGGTEGTATITSAAGTADAAATGLIGLMIRQGSAGNAPSGEIDGIKVGTTWASVTPTNASPLVTVSPTSLSFGSVAVGNTSTEQTYTVSGSNLTDTIFITAPAKYEISLSSGSGFGSSLKLWTPGGSVATTTIYTRFAPTANGLVQDTINHISAGAVTKKVAVSGTGTSCSAPNITLGGPTTICAGDSVLLTADPGVSYLWSNGETTQSIYAKIAGNYTVAVTDGSSCTATSLPTTISVNTFSYSGVVFSENMGSPSATTFINAYTGWQNNGILTFQSSTTTASDVRTTTASTGYAGASGSGNVFMGTSGTSARDLIIGNINTAGYSGITMSFGLLRSLNTDNIVVSVSTDGLVYTALTTSAQPPTNNVWALVTVSSGIPAASNLYIKFEKATGNSFRIDDITLIGSATSVSISASGTTAICSGSYVTLTSNIPNGNEWSPVFAFSQSIQATAAGSYTVTVTDLNNCSLTSSPVVVSVVAAPSATTSVTDALCAGDSTGTATAVGSGGAGGYTYSWNSTPVQTTATATGLPAGTYTVTVTDIGGCSGTSSATVGEPLPLQVVTSTTVPSTIGGTDGTATALAYDGTGPYTYSWNTSPVQNTDLATGLAAGTYIVTATDFNNCSATAQAVIVDPIPEITVTTTMLADFGSVVIGNSSAEDMFGVSAIYLTDSLLISASTGFEVSLSSGSGFGSNVTLYPSFGVVNYTNIYARFTPVGVGAVTGIIEHTSTGATQKDVAVSGTGISCAQPTVTVSGPTTFCAGDSVTLTSSAGNSYLWSNGETTQSIVVLISGSYSVTVTDAFACAATSSPEVVTVNSFAFTGAVFSENMGTPGGNTFVNSYTGWENQGAVFQSTLTNQADVRTSTASTGYLGASGSGNVFLGTAGGTNPRDFIISGINTVGYTGLKLSFGLLRTTTTEAIAVSVSTDGVVYSPITTTVQGAANTWVLISDSIGSIPATANLHIKFEKASSVSFRIDDIMVTGTTNSLIVTADGPTTICGGGTLVLTSNISVGNVWSPNAQLSQSINVTSSGIYYSVVTDMNGCSATSASYTVSVNPSPAVDTIYGTNLLCRNDSSGTATVTVSGGTMPYVYNWNSVPVQNTLTATGLKAGFYTFTVTDDNACTASAGLLITQPTALVVTASVISHPTSIGASDGSIASAASGGTTPYTYSWNSAPVQTADTASGLQAGIYTVTVVDSNGCTVTATDTLKDPLPEIFVSTNTIPDFGNILVGNSSTEATYNVSGINLTDSVLIDAPADFEISSTSGSGFGSHVSFYHTGGILVSTPVFVRFTPSAGGFVSGNITHTSTGALQKDVAVSGTGVTCSQATITPSGPTTFCAGGSVTLTASSGASYLWSNGETTSAITTDTSGTFSVIVTDAFSCSSTTAPTTVIVNTFGYTGAIFSEDMGNSGGTVALNTYTGWQNNGVYGFSTNTTGPSDVRTSSGSSGYAGASGFSNIFLGTAGGINPRNFIISGINTIGYTGMQISFGMHRTGVTENLTVEVSSDGVSYAALTTSAQPTPANTWGLVTATGAIPNTATLYIKFSKSSNLSFRLDDVKLSGSSTSPSISTNGPTTFCQGSQVKLTSNIPSGIIWSPGLQTTKSITVNTSGTFGFTATDLNGCVATAASVTVNVNVIPVVNATVTNVNCNGGLTGTATANVTAGTSPFTYSWNTSPIQTTQTATGLGAGTYKVVVIGAIGCKDSATVTVSEPPVLAATCSSTDISCNGLTDGTTSVSVTGGTGAYTYSWTGAPTTVTVDLSAVKDNNIFADNTSNSNAIGPNFVAGNNAGGFARRALLAFDIAGSIPPGATITSASLNLNMVHTSSGAGAQDFDLHQLLENWGEGTSFDAGNPGNGVPATAGDATWDNSFDPGTPWTTAGGVFNPSSSATTTVDAVGIYSWSGAGMVSDVQNWLDNPGSDFGWLLKGLENGTQQAKRFDSRENSTPANQPVLSITYSIPNILGTSSSLTGLSAGSYNVVVTDVNGCTASCSVAVNEPTAIVANCSVSNHVTCNGGSDGAVSVSGTGGTGTITVSGPATSGLIAGSYTYTLTDANGCSTTCTLIITEPAAIIISGFTPNSGPVGTIVTISGSGFTGASDVQFNGQTASYTVDNDGQITATVPGSATSGPITISIGTCSTASAGNFTVGSGSVDLDLTLFLEGYYIGGSTMRPTLYDLETYAVLPGPYPTDATDTIEVNLWSQSAVTANIAPDYSEKVILHSDGSASISFATATPGYYYIAVKHRNSMETWSKDSVLFTSGMNAYRFDSAMAQAYDDGVNPPMQDMGGGVFALYGGDINQDGEITGLDMNEIDNNAFAFGYDATDVTGDADTNGLDMNIVDNNAQLFLFYARP